MIIELTTSEYMDSAESYIGYCVACGEERHQCEPDARNYPCEGCGKKEVFGTEELLIMGQIALVD